jgi:hypothetical protein
MFNRHASNCFFMLFLFLGGSSAQAISNTPSIRKVAQELIDIANNATDSREAELAHSMLRSFIQLTAPTGKQYGGDLRAKAVAAASLLQKKFRLADSTTVLKQRIKDLQDKIKTLDYPTQEKLLS